MKILGIVAEYNPFHGGHLSHLKRSEKISEADAVVVIMSGNFVQRGEPALVDKWKRTKAALLAGADLVIELPLCCATASAGYFAKGAVTLLEKTGIVDCMCFGSECGDIEILKECAKALLTEDEQFKKRMRGYLKQGFSYPVARSKAVFETSLPDTPNNVLGIEYIKALMELESEITPYTVFRSSGSAKEIRDTLKKGSHNFADLNNLSSIFHYILRTKSPSELGSFLDVAEGLENRLKQCAKENYLISDIIASAKTKRYTYLRLQRVVLHMILGITKVCNPEYIRVLGFREKRANLLQMLERQARLPIVTNIKNAALPPLAAKILDEEIRSTAVYSLAYPDFVYFNEYAMELVKV